MIKKHDELIAAKRAKEQRLAQLYSELDAVTHLNLVEDVAHLEVSQKMQARGGKSARASKQFQNKLGETLYDANSASSTFNFTNLESILEHRTVLLEKIELADTRVQEEVLKNSQYQDMLHKMDQDGLSDSKRNQFVSERGKNMTTVVRELDMVNFIEN